MPFVSEEHIFRLFVRSLGGKVKISRRGYIRDGDRDCEAMSVVGEWDGWLSGSSSVPDGVPVRVDTAQMTLLMPVDADIRAGDGAVYLPQGQTEGISFLVTGEPVRFPTHIEVKVQKHTIV